MSQRIPTISQEIMKFKLPIVTPLVAALIWLGIQFLIPGALNADHWPLVKSFNEKQLFIETILSWREKQNWAIRRPIVLNCITLIHRAGFSYYLAIVLFNFICFFLCCLFIQELEFCWTKKRTKLSLLLFISSYSIFFASMPPIYTFSEPFQYCMILLSFWLFDKSSLMAFIPFGLAAIERENTLFLLPGILLTTKLKRTLPFLLGSSLGVISFFIFPQAPDMPDRFQHFHKNFLDSQSGIESVASILLALGMPAFLLLINVRVKELSDSVKNFSITTLITVLITLNTGRAREARLFALPLLWVWPLSGMLLEKVFHHMRQNRIKPKKYCYFVGYSLLGIFLILKFYHPTISSCPDLVKLWSVIFLLFTGGYFSLSHQIY